MSKRTTSKRPRSLDLLLAEKARLVQRLATLRALISEEIVRQRNRLNRIASEELLTRREEEVFNLIRAGKSNKEIGNELNMSERGVKFHVTHILRKYRAQTRHEL